MKFAVYGQYYQQNTEEIICEILQVLDKNKVKVVLEKNYYDLLLEKKISIDGYATFSSYKDLNSSFDILISIGGDGTILRAATFVRDSRIPILGINAGRLGFLANIQKENIEQFLNFIFEKKYSISPRTLLSLGCNPKNTDINQLNFAMNEVTVNRKDTTAMITIETYLNGEYLNSYWADGLIISTPTGSTGYSLSCGGPLLTPNVSSLVITPIAPHNLNARPLVIPDDTEIILKVSGRESQYLVSLDSRITFMNNETILSIRKTSFKINMIEFTQEGFLKTIRKKLLWGEDKRN